MYPLIPLVALFTYTFPEAHINCLKMMLISIFSSYRWLHCCLACFFTSISNSTNVVCFRVPALNALHFHINGMPKWRVSMDFLCFFITFRLHWRIYAIWDKVRSTFSKHLKINLNLADFRKNLNIKNAVENIWCMSWCHSQQYESRLEKYNSSLRK